jgi:hypothetical protein
MEMYFDFMTSDYAWNWCLANLLLIDVSCDSQAERLEMVGPLR